MSESKLTGLILKPTLFCTANCKGCASRRDLHKSVRKEKALSLDRWIAVLNEAKPLGLEQIKISGGEPTLYPHLLELIKAAKALDLRIRLNTNGSQITENLAEQLLTAGLDAVCISIYSHKAAIHDNFRQQRGLWNRATQAVRIFAKLIGQKNQSRFSLQTMTIILRENYRSLDELMQLHHRIGSQQMGIAYLEGDYSGDYLLTKSEIQKFKQETIPKLLDFCDTLDLSARVLAKGRIKNLYSSKTGTLDNLAKGIYWRRGACPRPKSQGLILANGDIHPCNIVEYTHKPVMGNYFHNDLSTIWNSEAWSNYRMEFHEKCAYCPVNIYQNIPLASRFRGFLEKFPLKTSEYLTTSIV